MDSYTKIIDAADQLAAAAGGDTLTATLVAMKPLALMQLPKDPDVLDASLEQFAHMLLELRSDDAPRLAVYAVGEDVATPAEEDAALAEPEPSA